jgi:hypothetical protein
MADPTDKTELLETMQSSYAAFEALLAPLSETQLTAPDVSGEWSIKDILVHLATWQGRAAEILEAAQRNEQPQLNPPIKTDEEMDRFNDATFAANCSRPLVEVKQNFHVSYQRLQAAVEALSENALFDPQHFAWTKEQPLWRTAEGDTFGHYQEHAPIIEAWLTRQKA